ncbi:pyridoxamine 5'-phosphate oxidase family protein [Sphingomonas sp.]|uniref:pyridoxamine 5'-phosphate oxidase family protein n=1 Tax=Sphingomonas sp. TaxID=28214 RepID=UPI00325FC332
MFDNDEGNDIRLRKQFWNALSDSPFMMLGLEGVEDDQTRPMSAQIDAPDDRDKEDGGQIYFFALKTEGVGKSVTSVSRAVATFSAKDHRLFAHVHGSLVEDYNRNVIERLWSPSVAAWYKGGKNDPNLKLLRFDTENATIWEADKSATLKAAALKALFDFDPGKEHSHDHKADVTL